MKYLEFLCFRVLVAIFWIIPYPILYCISDFLYFLFFYVLKYRYKVVFDNLRKSFPEKSDKEIRNLAKKFYQHLADISLESIKGMSISEKEIQKRYIVNNCDIPDNYFNKNMSIICLTAHYGNWEYGMLALNSRIKHQAAALYLPLTNKYSEKYGLKRRSRFGMKIVPIQQTKELFSLAKDSPIAIVMAADQSPSNMDRAIWLNFLNRETACLHGIEAYVKKMNFPAVYMKISKPKRGYYNLDFETLIDPNTQEYSENEVSKIYFKRLEKDIIEKPEYWLWSHRRWKHKKN